MAKFRKSLSRGKPVQPAGTSRATLLAVCLVLGVATLLLYVPVRSHSFINYDDNQYVLENLNVTTGLTWQNVQWAFRSGYAANWHPLTWISHMVDCELFGLKAGPQHLVSALLHAASVVLLFLALLQMTGLPWRSTMVAALFACHPTHVESVAWIAERKDVLSAFFWMLTLLAYARYSACPTLARYSIVLSCVALGLLSKPMVVTLPCVLLLLDYWPLNRLRTSAQFRPLLLEKIPLFALSTTASIITYLVQKGSGAVVSMDGTPLLSRLGNALLTYFFYLGKTFWPSDLFVPYWYEFKPELLPLAGAGLAVAGITFCAVRFGRRTPYLPTGWFWFIGVLVPVIGIIQVGSQSAADRYTYLPSIGIFICVVWGITDLLVKLRTGRSLIVGMAVAVLAVCAVLSSRQIGYWKNSVTLFTHALQVDPPNLVAMNLLAWTFATDRDPLLRNPAQALRLATLTVEITQRQHAVSLRTLAAAYAGSGQLQLAAETAREAFNLPDAKRQPHLVEGIGAEIFAYDAGRNTLKR